jgi:hypothetical protein
MAENSKSGVEPGDFSPELVPVVELGTAELIIEPTPTAIVDGLVLGDLLSDALFGEVIDISDLIPRLSSEAEANVPAGLALEVTAASEAGVTGGADLLAASGHAAALTIFYDDDLLASASAIL